MTCGSKAQLYCFECNNFVRHEIFDQEKQRIDVAEALPWLAWKEQPVQRSFEALQFLHVHDLGIFWTGMRATYPILVPNVHKRAAWLSRERQIVLHGEVDELPTGTSQSAIQLTARQYLTRTYPTSYEVREGNGVCFFVMSN